MAATLEQVVKQLEDSGIVAAGKLKECLPPKANPASSEELVKELVKQKHLTPFQAQHINAGKTKSLLLGSYTIIDKIGAGGMGQVFKALHRRMDRTVAIKMLPPAMTKDAAAAARFEREVRAAAKLSHPNIVAAHDADQANGVYFLVMEYVEGKDLSASVKKDGPFPVAKAVNYILQAARGLEFAHSKGVIHRDIKPANLLLSTDGTVKILDMGLARLDIAGESGPQDELTGTGTIMGTVDYMAPEQAVNTKHADHRADIYSLGITLYYLLAGKAAYTGDTVMEKLLAHREKPIPSLRNVQPDISDQLQAVFSKMVAKKIEDRYQSMTEVVTALEQCSSGQSTFVSGPPSRTVNLDNSALTFLKDIPAQTTFQAKATKKPAKPAADEGGSKNKKPLLIGAAAAGFLAVLLGVIVIIKNQKGEEIGRIELPPGQTAEVQTTSTKPAVVPKVAGKTDTTKSVKTWNTPTFQQWMRSVAAMPADEQVAAVIKELQKRNFGFDGKVTPRIEKGVVTGISFISDNVTDISPLRALSGLAALSCDGSGPGKGRLFDLSPIQGMPLTRLTFGNTLVSNISPLQEMKLAYLGLGGTKVSDVSALRGMPLGYLGGSETLISDVSPLRGMHLTYLALSGSPINDLSPVHDCKSLRTLLIDGTEVTAAGIATLQKALPECTITWDGGIQAAKPITTYKDPAFQAWMKQVAAMSAEKQIEAVSAKLMELNPGFDGKFLGGNKISPPIIRNGVVEQVSFSTDDVTDISPLRVFQRLQYLRCDGTAKDKGRLSDLSPLQGMPLVYLTCDFNKVADVSPLKGMTLTHLSVSDVLVTDLSPLRGMPLVYLGWSNSPVSDLSPLKGMPLETLSFSSATAVDLSPLKGMPLKVLVFYGTPILDLSPLQGMNLTDIRFTPNSITKGIEILRPMTSLKTIRTGGSEKETFSPAEFWKKYDTGEFGKAPSPTTTDDADRRAAEWVLSKGGKCQVKSHTKAVSTITSSTGLPKDAFTLFSVDLKDRALTDDDLRIFQDITTMAAATFDSSLKRQTITDAGLAYLTKNTKLTSLGLNYQGITDAGVEQLRGMTELNSLRLTETKVTVRALETIKNFKKLEQLQIQESVAFQGPVLEVIVTLPLLKYLWLPKLDSPQSYAPITNLKNLTELGCFGSTMNDVALDYIVPLQKLTYLYLNGTGITDAGLLRLKELRKLEALDLIGSPSVTDGGLANLQGTTIKNLNLKYTRIGDQGLANLHAMKNLKSLNLTETKVTAAGVAALQKALPNCKIEWPSLGQFYGQSASQADPARKAAEWVPSKGGTVGMSVNGKFMQLSTSSNIPKGPCILKGCQKTQLGNRTVAA
jgi:serine/threonine protein kinase/Leucine-rich repeat (LRR) protein